MTETDETPPPVVLLGEPLPGPSLRRDARKLAWLATLAVLLVLAGTQAALWYRVLRPPAGSQTLDPRVPAIDARLARLEQRPVPQVPDLGPLTARVAGLEQKAPDQKTPDQNTGAEKPDQRLPAIEARLAHLEQSAAPSPSDLSPLQARAAALEGRPAGSAPNTPAPVSPQPASPLSDNASAPAGHAAAATGAAPKVPDLGPLEARIAALEHQSSNASPPGADTSLVQRLTAAEAKLAALEKTAPAAGQSADRTNRIARIQAAFIALSVGEPLGELPGAPPALTRYATAAPPTEAALRLAFPAASLAALAADHPAPSDKPVLDRIWAEAQTLVTVRQGEHVLLGDPAAGVLAHAQTALDAGDLAGAAAAVASLSGPSAQALAPWLDQARGLLAARAALAALAAQT